VTDDEETGEVTIECTDGTTGTVTDGEDGRDGVDGEDGEDGEPGADGDAGVDGEDGEDGDDGLNSLIATSSEPAGANCQNGGQRIQVGLDDDGDGTLDGPEIQSTVYVCNGVHGAGAY
jgi:hypothetical protein